jgi:hypothetical protein
MNAINNIGNRRSERLYINSVCVSIHLIMNFKVKSARIPRRGASENFEIFGKIIKNGIKNALHRLQHYFEIIWITYIFFDNFSFPKYIKIDYR